MKLPRWTLPFRPEVLFLTLVLFFVFLTNFTPSTYLIGWDNLMPELNIWMNLKRSLFAVWQEYQGLGLVGGMGHATDLIRQLIILPLTYIIPNELIRYMWHFGMISLGTYSIFFSLKKFLKFSSLISLCASLFYLLNFGSVQNFWAPFEPFSTFWGFFPFLIFSLWSYLQKPTKSSIIKLTILNILAIPSFYVQTVFIVYLLSIFFILLSYFIFNTTSIKTKVYHSLKIVFIIFLLNSFWLLPFFYFLKNNVENTRLGIGNLMATQETIQRNYHRGHLTDFLLLRGYYYDVSDNSTNFMTPWVSHFSNHYFLIAGYLLSALVILGLIFLILKKNKNFVEYSIIGIFILCTTALLSATPPFSYINQQIRSLDFLNQVFRSPFTKFITPAVFIFSILIAYGLQTLLAICLRLKYSIKIFSTSFFLIFFLLIITYIYPIFTGNYIYKAMRQPISRDYQQLIEYFKNVSATARIANLPQGDYWGWTNYRQGIRGSGFLWYGIQQPILDRAFDVWQLNNETYYWEISQALSQKSSQTLEKIFQKYSIQYVIFDNNVYFPNQLPFSKIATKTKELLTNIPSLKLVATFGQINIFQTGVTTSLHTTNSVDNTQILPTYFTNRTPLNQPPLSLLTPPINVANFQPISLSDSLGYHLSGYSFPTAPLNQDYLLKISYRHLAGYPLIIGVYPSNNQFRYTTTKLDSLTSWHDQWFFLPKMEKENFNTGISIVLNNASFTNAITTNQISSISLYPVTAPPTISTTNSSIITPPSQSSIFLYSTILKNNQLSNYLVLPQSFEKGWLAFYLDGLRPVFLKNHILINNWANGWSIPSVNNQIKVYIFFWPQLLEFVGLGFLLITLISILKTNRHPSSS